MLRAEGLDIYADRLRHTDGVGDLNLALLSVSGENDIPRNLSSHIGTGTVHLGSVFAAHGTTADMSDAAVSVAHTIFEIQFLLSAPSLTPMAEQLWRFCYT